MYLGLEKTGAFIFKWICLWAARRGYLLQRQGSLHALVTRIPSEAWCFRNEKSKLTSNIRPRRNTIATQETMSAWFWMTNSWLRTGGFLLVFFRRPISVSYERKTTVIRWTRPPVFLRKRTGPSDNVPDHLPLTPRKHDRPNEKTDFLFFFLLHLILTWRALTGHVKRTVMWCCHLCVWSMKETNLLDKNCHWWHRLAD